MIWLELLNRSARMAGLLKRPGVGLNGSEQAEIVHLTNSHLDGLKAERLFVYQVIRTVEQVKQGQQDYLVGMVGDNADWIVPGYFTKLYAAGFLVPGGTSVPSEIPMEVILSYTQWQAIITKGVVTSQPRVIYYRVTPSTTGTNTGTASIWAVPTVDSQLVLYTPGQVDEIGDITDTVVMPIAHLEFLEYSLAVAINEGYPNLVMKPSVAIKAAQFKQRVKANQFTPTFIRSDGAALQSPDATRSGWWSAREWPGGYI